MADIGHYLLMNNIEFRPAANGGWNIYRDGEYVGYARTLARAAEKAAR